MVGGRQAVSIGYGCESVGIAAHEIGHALGFWHEQTRYDRDSYVQIIAGSITSGASGNFEKRSRNEMVTYGIPYDFGSVMHYGSTAFGINNALTIRSIDPNYQYTMGQRLGLSFYDIKFINIAYCNSVCSNPLPCQNNGYTDPKNCNQCRCPDGFGGQYCNRAATGSSGCDPGDLTATTSWQTISQSGRGTCYWLITAPPGQQVILDVTAFSFRSATTCINEYLEIKFDTDLGNTDGPPVTVPPTTRPTTTRPTTTTPRPTTTSTTQTTTQSTSTGTTTQPSATGWASWGPWSSCSASCGGCGVRARRRDCYGLPCPGSIDSVELCNFNLCPGPELQSNGECSKEQQIPCESNTQNLCTKRIPVSCKDSQLDAKAAECCWPLSSDGTQCILGVAPATTTTTTTTTTTQDPLVSGTWGPWSEWTPCVGATCGGCGRRYRQRECLKDPCSGQSTMSEACNFNACICNQSVCANPCCAPYVFIPPDRCGQMANAVTGPPTDEHSSKV
uniref:Metalloendopeptidase n=1 Tax=Plectus sambesii TaxID=2011161 RepID=A0A914W9G6_9BILA